MSQPALNGGRAAVRYDRASRWSVWGALVLAVAYPLYMWLEPSSGRQNVVGNVGMTLTAGWAAAAAYQRYRRGGPLARTTLLLSAYCATWMFGQAAWTYYETFTPNVVPFPSAADIGYLCAMPFGIAATVSLLPNVATARLRALLDGVMVACCLLYLAWPIMLKPMIEGGGSAVEVAIGFAYPAGDTTMIAVVVGGLTRTRLNGRNVLLLLAGLLMLGLGDGLFAYLSVLDHYSTGNPADLGWLVGFLLIAASAWNAEPSVSERTSGAAIGESELSTSYWRLVTPYLFLLPMMVTTAVLVATGRGLDNALIAIGLATVVALAVRQVSTLIESENRARDIHRQATHDGLTSLWNRQRFRLYVDAAVRDRRADTAVLFIDVDDFKDINDSAGHSVGDAVLQELSARLQQCTRDDDRAARLGGDEFAVAACVASPREAIQLANRVVDALARPVLVDGHELQLSVSVGIAVSPDHGDTAELLLRNADLAMYGAKRAGKNRYRMYEPAMHASVVERIEITAQLERALARDELRLHFQSVHDLTTGDIVGAEALLRWEHAARGTVSPVEFIAAAEASGLIVPIGAWALDRSCAFLVRLEAEGLLPDRFRLCVNVAASQLQRPEFVATVSDTLERWGVQPARVVLELTESALIDAPTALPVLRALKRLGVGIAVDDFGTGYSSLSYLHRFPVDILKIDRSFVAEADRGVEAEAMTRAIVTLGRSLGLHTVAEGVELDSQLTALRGLGCDSGQGYLWSAAVPEDEFALRLASARQQALSF